MDCHAESRAPALSLAPAYEAPVGPEYWQEWRSRLPTSRSPNVVLHGGYGKLNLGDDAILHVLLRQIGAGMPDARISVICHGPEWVCRRYGVAAHHFASAAALRAILGADLYVIGGGGIINKINTYSGRRKLKVLDPKGKFLFLAALLARRAGARVIFHVVGATSVPDSLVAWLARLSMSRADEVSVRDPLSQRVVRELGVWREIRLLPDPAVSLDAADAATAMRILKDGGVDPTRRLVGLNLRPVLEPDVDNRETARTVAALADWIIDRFDAQVCFLPYGRHPSKAAENDLGMAREVGAQMLHVARYRILERECTPPEMKAIMGQMGYCLLERLHATILAAGMGTPFLAISYDAKVSEFMRAIGRDADVVPLRGLNVESARKIVDASIPWRPM